MQNDSIYTNPDAELAVLMSILAVQTGYDEVEGILSPDDFSDSRNRIVYETISALKDKGVDYIDFLMIIRELTKNGRLQEAGGESYVSGITSGSIISANIHTYARMVRECSLRRQLRSLSSSWMTESGNTQLRIEDILDKAGEAVFRLAESKARTDEGVDAMDLISKAINIISDKMEGTYNDRSVITGYSKLDIMLNGGFRPQDYVIIAARPSIGKTAFAVSMMLHMLDEGKSVVFYSLEMSDIQIANRMLAAASGVNLRSIIKGSFSETEFDPLLEAGNRLVTEKLTVIDTPNMRLSDIRSTARMLKRKGKADIIIIDYIGLIDAGLRNGTPRHEAVAYVSRSLKQLARELDIPIVALSQVTRDSEEREPLLSSLRDSGSIEQDADTVMFLHRKRELTDEDLSKCPKNRRGQVMIGTKVILAKQRNGETGSILTAYIPATASFRDADNSISFIEPDANR